MQSRNDIGMNVNIDYGFALSPYMGQPHIKIEKEKNWLFESPVFFVFFLSLGSPSSRNDVGMIQRKLVWY